MVGALVSSRNTLPEHLAAPITAFGGGVLLAAVALGLVPEADAEAGLGATAIGMLLGTAVFVGADAWLSAATRSGSGWGSSPSSVSPWPVAVMAVPVQPAVNVPSCNN
jgi:hypothetical protein